MENNHAIEALLRRKLSPIAMTLRDDRQAHAKHREGGGGGHYELYLVSSQFAGLTLLERQRVVHDILRDFFGKDIHALTMKLLAPEEVPS